VEDVYAKEAPPDLGRLVRREVAEPGTALTRLQQRLDRVTRLMALCAVRPRDVGLSQRRPFLFEVGVGGGDIQARFEFLKGLLGREVRLPEVFKAGAHIDVIAITKGKGFEGPVTRLGIKRKQAKSRKSVRAVGALNPWHPATVMYTVPRAGQRGFHQRVEYNKKILLVGAAEDVPVTPQGGFPHFGVVRGGYVLVRGSVPGAAKRLVEFRVPMRPPRTKVQPPRVLQISVRGR
jgi:large subunit ribosomal protein L3